MTAVRRAIRIIKAVAMLPVLAVMLIVGIFSPAGEKHDPNQRFW